MRCIRCFFLNGKETMDAFDLMLDSFWGLMRADKDPVSTNTFGIRKLFNRGWDYRGLYVFLSCWILFLPVCFLKLKTIKIYKWFGLFGVAMLDLCSPWRENKALEDEFSHQNFPDSTSICTWVVCEVILICVSFTWVACFTPIYSFSQLSHLAKPS